MEPCLRWWWASGGAGVVGKLSVASEGARTSLLLFSVPSCAVPRNGRTTDIHSLWSGGVGLGLGWGQAGRAWGQSPSLRGERGCGAGGRARDGYRPAVGGFLAGACGQRRIISGNLG